MQSRVSNYGQNKRNFKRNKNQELGFESLQQRSWSRKLCCLFKIIKNRSPSYLYQLVPSSNSRYLTRNSGNISKIRTNHNFFKNSFFPSAINEWNNLALDIRSSGKVSFFKSIILKFIWPKPNSIYNCHNSKGIRLITRLHISLRIQWRLIFAIVIRCFRLQNCVGYFTYFKITRAFRECFLIQLKK